MGYKEALKNTIYFFPRLFFLNKLKKLENSKSGQRCFILGNGPSLADIDLTQLQNEDTFVVNHFAAGGRVQELNPSYYCASDPRLFSPIINKEWADMLKNYPEQTQLFITDRFFYKTLPGINSERIFHIKYINKKVWNEGKISVSPAMGFYSGDTVVIDFCLPLAFFMGYSEIYILGVDLYKTKKEDDQHHFYDESKITASRRSDDYLKNEWNANVIKSFEVAKEYCENNGIKFRDLKSVSAINLETESVVVQ